MESSHSAAYTAHVAREIALSASWPFRHRKPGADTSQLQAALAGASATAPGGTGA